jgi:integrase
MASLYKRGRMYWISFRINGKLVQRSLKTDNYRAAKQKVQKIEYELAIGDLRQTSRTPLADVIESFCRYLQTTRPAKSCYNVYNRLRAIFGPVCDSLQPRQPGSPDRQLHRVFKHDKFAGRHLPAKLLEDVTPAVINRWLDDRAQEEAWSPKTINNYRQTIHRLFSYAIKRHDFISRDRRYPNPATGVERRKEPASEIRFLTLDQIDTQLEALTEHPTLHAMVAVYIYAGLRREEALWLTTDDVDCSTSA